MAPNPLASDAIPALIEKLRVLVAEVWYAHRDPSDPNYNDCEKPGEACQWCVETRAHLDALSARTPPTEPHHVLPHGDGDSG